MKTALLALCFILLNGCASTPKPPSAFKALPEAVRSEIRSMEVLIGVDQQEIEVGNRDYVRLPLERSEEYGSAAMQGMHPGRLNGRGDVVLITLGILVGVAVVSATTGLVVGTGEAGVEGYRNFMANRAVAPVNRSLAGFEFGERLREALIRPGGPRLLLQDGRVTLVSPATPENFEAHHAMSAHDSVMSINVRYAVSSDLNTLTLKAEANLFPKSDTLWKLQYEYFRKGQRMDKLPGALQTDVRHSLYRRVMTYQMTLPRYEEDRDKAAQAWSANDGALVRSAFNEGLGVIARLVASDLAGNAGERALDMDGKRYGVVRDKQEVTLVRRLPDY